MIVTKLALPRRTFLRGVGAALALPLLDAMVPAFTPLAQSAGAPIRRMGFIYAPNGFIREFWTPDTAGSTFDLKPSLKALEPFRDQMQIVSGLRICRPRRWARRPAPTRAAVRPG
jgi:hypothetical protein